MTTPISEPLLTVPFVGVLEFRAAPTWLDTEDLIQAGTGPQQDAELYNVLLRASAWANNCVRQPLQGHTAHDFTEARVDRRGRIFLHPKNTPIRSVTGFAYGSDPQNLTELTDLSTVWIEDQRGILVADDVLNARWAGSLQFGTLPTTDRSVYVYYEYVAGYGNGQLVTTANSGSGALALDNALGFQGPSTSPLSTSYGASVARIWDPALEEAVTVSSVSTNTLNLSGTTTNSHTGGTGVQVSEMPAEVRQAVICYAVGLLLRDNVSTSSPWGGSPGPTARRAGSGGRAGGLINEAESYLAPYRRVR